MSAAAGPRVPGTIGRAARGGRDRTGRRSVRHRGGGHKRRRRGLLCREPAGVHQVIAWDYDPARRALLARVDPGQGQSPYYRLATAGAEPGSTISVAPAIGAGAETWSRPRAPGGGPAPGTRAPLRVLPLDQDIHALELVPGEGACLARAVGSEARRIGRVRGRARVRLASGEVRARSPDCRATLGAIAGPPPVPLRKAGQSRWLGRRPRVRGVARNPVDHPLGGGEGKSSGGRAAVSPWSRPEGERTTSGRGRRFIVRPRAR